MRISTSNHFASQTLFAPKAVVLKKPFFKVLVAMMLLLVGNVEVGWGQTVVTVGGGATVTCPATPTATWTTPPAGVTFSNWSRGSGVACGTAATALSGSTFSSASASAAFTANKFYSVTITADATHSFTLSSVVWSTVISSGACNFTVQYSNNGGAITTFGTGGQTSTSSNTFTGSVSVAAGTSIILYLTPYGATSTSTIRWVNGSTITVTAATAGSAPPTLTAAGSASVDAAFDVTFTDDPTWRAAAGTAITVGGTTLTAGYAFTAGKITFTPSASNPAGLLQTAGASKAIVISKTGYTDATVSQTIVAGAANKLQLLMPGEVASAGSSTGKTAATPTAQVAGTTFNATVNSVDQYWNVVSSTRSIAITSSDVNATLPANAALVAGTGTFAVTFKTAASATVTATDQSGSAITANTGASTTVNAGTATKYQLLMPSETAAPGTLTGKTGSPNARNAGTSFNIIVNAVDANWNKVTSNTSTVTITSTDANATLPAAAALVAGTNTYSITFKTAGAATASATGLLTTGVGASAIVNVGAGSKLQLLMPGETASAGSATGKIGTPTAQTAGTSFNVTVNAVDVNWNVVNNTSTIVISSSDVNATLPANAALVAGTKTFAVTFKTAGSKTVTATDNAATLTANTGASTTVNAGTVNKLQLLMPGEVASAGTATGKTIATPTAQVAGTSYNVTVNAVDANWNVVNTNTSTIVITSSDANATLPANAALVAGTKTYAVTNKTAGSNTVTATDNAATLTANTGASTTVNAGTVNKLQLLMPGETAVAGTSTGKTGTPTTQTVNTAYNVTVNAVDANWNLVNTNTSTIVITSSDANATLPANAALVAGTKSYAITNKIAGSKTVTATDNAALLTANTGTATTINAIAPDAPTIGIAVAGNTTADVTFTAPIFNGGSAITSYTATSNPGGFTGTLSQAGSGTITVAGLTNGTPYTFTVTATNAAGTGLASAASNSVTPTAGATVPGAPTAVSATRGNTQATISFTAPASDGGDAIISYTVTSNPGSFTASGSSSPLTVTGLTNGTAYTFTVIATNSIGNSLASSASNSVTPATTPGVPTITGITVGNTQLSVAFSIPLSDGGSAITSYKYSTDGGTSFRTRAAGTTASPLVITTLSSDGTTALTNGTSYNIQILAVNAVGDGTATGTTAATPATTATAPTITGIIVGNTQLTVAFTAPTSNGGAAITNYKYSTDGGTSFTAVSPASTSSPIVITGLTNGTSYNVQIRAVNAIGDGTATVSTAATPATTPGIPTGISITPGNTQLSVAFTAPASTGGSAITNYKYSIDGGSTFFTRATGTTASPILITGLTNGTSYNVQIKAVNTIGDGTATTSTVGTPNVTYCASTGPASAGSDYFTNFTASGSAGGIANTSTFSANGYGDFTAQSVSQGVGATVTYSASSPGIANGSSFGIFVDWNQDGDFADANETVVSIFSPQPTANPSGSFIVPAGATLGNTRMRIVIKDATGAVVSCNTALPNSEIEDYTFTVVTLATPPTLTATTPSASVDGSFTVTFPTNATYTTAIGAGNISIGGVILTPTTDYTVSGNTITFTPSVSGNSSLRTPGSYTISVNASGYNAATVSQTMIVGAASQLAINTQPTAPASNGAVLAVQPVVNIVDKYGNTTASTTSVLAAVSAGTWTLGGSATVSATAGTATFSGLTASSTVAVTGATIAFSSGSLTGVTSATFNIVAPDYRNINALGTAVTEDFASLLTSATATLPGGFKVNASGVAPNYTTGTSVTTLAAGTTGTGALTTSNSGGVFNFADGVTGTATDRALGFLTAGSSLLSPNSIILKIANNTGSTINNLNISFDYEKYRDGSRQNDWTFFHGSATNPSTAATAGDLSYAASAANTVLNPATTTSKTVPLTGLSITAGSIYYLKWTLTGLGGNTNSVGSGIDNVSITATASSSVTVTGTAPFSYTYDGTAKTPSFTSTGSSATITYLYSGTGITGTTATAPTNAGTYSVTASVAANGGFAAASSSATAFTINPASSSITTAPTAAAITYGAALSTSSLTGGVGSPGGGTFAFTSPSTVPNAGTASYSVTYTPADVTNYNTSTTTVSVTVNKSTPSITTAPTASAITFGQTLASSTVSGGSASVAGSFAFTTPATAPNAGTASQPVTFTPTDVSNYNTASTSASVQVNAASVTITPDAGQNKVFGGANPIYTFTTSPTVSTTGALSRVTGESVGTYAYTLGTVSAGSNYTLSLDGSNTFAITGTPPTNAEFRSNGPVNFTSNANWQFDQGGNSWVPSGVAPTTNNNISIRNGHTATLNTLFTVGANKSLVLESGGKLVIESASRLEMTNNTSTINFGGQSVTLKSDATGTASIGSITGTLSGATNVTVERYIPAHTSRAWRLLSVPTKGAQTIRDAWQEGTLNPNPLDNNLPGYGTQITTPFANATGNGFDKASTANSLLEYNGTSWLGATSTNTSIETLGGYFLYVRGERTKGTTGTLTDVSATTLRTTGELYQGPVSNPTIPANSYAVIGNIYPSRVDFTKLTKAGLDDVFYIWDAKKISGNTLGFYQTFSGADGYAANVSGGSFVVGNKYPGIESGQAFFVHNIGTTTGSVGFTEAAKVTGSTNAGFRPATPAANRASFTSNLYTTGTDSYMADANKTVFDDQYSNAVDGHDALKLFNTGENFAIQQKNKTLAIEARQPITDKDTIFFNLTNLQKRTYQLELKSANLNVPGLTAILQDAHTGNNTILNLAIANTINFTVDATPASSAANRFRVVFAQTSIAPLPVSFINVSASHNAAGNAITWKVAAESNMAQYEVERSADGRSFAKTGTVAASAQSTYSFTDAQALSGTVFYRIKGIGLAGEVKYSAIVKLTAGNIKPGYSISPNPAEGNMVNLQFKNQAAGNYHISISTIIGQHLFTNVVAHPGGSSTQVLNITETLAAGTYQLEIIAPDKSRQTQSLVIKSND